jgi:hypothetical protein
VSLSRKKTKTATAAHLALTMGFPLPFMTNARTASTDSVKHLPFFVFYSRRAPEMHTDGLLGGCEYCRHLWGSNM